MSLAALCGFQAWASPLPELPASIRMSELCGWALTSSGGGLRSIGESLLELSPGPLSRSVALTRSERGGARLGVRGEGFDVVSGDWAFAGAEFCAPAPRVQASIGIRSEQRIGLFYRRRCFVRSNM